MEASALLKDAYAQVYLAQGELDKAETSLDARKIFQEIAYYRLGEAILCQAKSHLALRHFPETRAQTRHVGTRLPDCSSRRNF